ncbi:trypsin-like serine protease [Streptomyces sp. CRN 30]|uniref:trypsin-like serine protease n=1 Tax=Streptomyces sp. CRN 30 TaxID=3075613 RepID=UPI002A80CFD9|nr:trypsin-like serine protease [Streptomyces sp. CRN 30]
MTLPRKSVRASAGATLAAAVAASALLTTPAHAVAGDALPAGSYAFTAKVSLGTEDTARACSGALVATDWILTAASCFAADPEAPSVAAGKPPLTATATVAGKTSPVVQLVPRAGRDLVLARLSRPVTAAAPVAVATAAPAAGDSLVATGWGRTATEWVPGAAHTTAFTVDSVGADDLAVTGVDGALCQGDTGGPLLRVTNGTAELVGVNSRSWQGGCLGETETRTGAVAARSDDLSAWVAATVATVPVTDFDCDGTEDVAIADPEATVGGMAKAGLVRIVYGGGKGTAEISQDLDWVPGAAEAGDGFGTALATVDYDEDGCTDLVVGSPDEDLAGEADAGMVDILHGASGGLGTGTVKNTHYEQGSGNGSLGSLASESGDRMGASLAASVTRAGEPYFVIGVPGEEINGSAKAGEAIYVHGSTNAVIHQDRLDVPGAVEADDAFGSAVAADANHLVITSPGEAIGTLAAAGGLTVFDPNTLNSENRPTPLFGLDQDLDTVGGASEAGDRFGHAVALATYRPSGATAATESILAVGSPGEDIAVNDVTRADAGYVQSFRITAAGVFTQLNGYSSGTNEDDVSGTSEAGDRFGETLAAVNTAPHAVSTAATVKLAVGIPGEAIGTTAEAGAITTFSLLGNPGDTDKWIETGDGDGVPGTSGTGQRLGSSLHYTGTRLYVGMPDGPVSYGALYALPLSNVTAGGSTAAVTTYQPGTGGLPAAGAAFGRVAR